MLMLILAKIHSDCWDFFCNGRVAVIGERSCWKFSLGEMETLDYDIGTVRNERQTCALCG